MTSSDGAPSFKGANDRDDEANAIAELSKQLESERESKRDERFLFTLVIIVMADALIFNNMIGWSGPIVIGAIEMVGLTVLARKWDVREVAELLAKFFQRIADHTHPRSPGG